jgi:tripartite-type tricarboxylate transporter receptor subunit TctC
MPQRRTMIAAAVAAIAGGVHRPALAQAFASRAVTLVVNSAAGGGADLLARALAEGLRRETGASFVVENRPGGAGNIAALRVARAAADGHELLVADSGTISIGPALSRTPQFDPVGDFTPIARIAAFPLVVAAHPSLGARSLRELEAMARRAPRSVDYASTGVGSPQHLAAELLQRRGGFELNHIPYRGGAPATLDLTAGRVRLAVIGVPPLAALIKENRLLGLAITSPARIPLLPDVPTVAETYPGFSADAWFGLFAPRSTPPAVVGALGAATAAVTASEQFRGFVAMQGMREDPGDAAALRDMLAAELDRLRELSRSINLVLD